MIGLQRLEGFYWVARTGGYARAARAFPYPITQPAVHQQVKKLEAELGLDLFERVAKDRMALTSAGSRLFEFVAPFFEGLPTVLNSIQAGEYGGELRVHTSSHLLRYWMPAWIRRLHAKRPDLQLHVRETEANLEDLRNGRCDVLIDYLPDLPDDIASLAVGSTRPFVILPRGHRLAKKRKLQLEAFGQDSFISYPPGSRAQSLQYEALRRFGVHPERTLSANSAEGILGLVEAGLGYSIVPSVQENGPKAAGVLTRPLDIAIEFPILAAWRKDTPENPLLDALLETAPRAKPA